MKINPWKKVLKQEKQEIEINYHYQDLALPSDCLPSIKPGITDRVVNVTFDNLFFFNGRPYLT